MKTATVMMILCAALSALTGCGFECSVNGEARAFGSCEELQQAYDTEQSSLDPPPNGTVLDDLDTCGNANGCNIVP